MSANLPKNIKFFIFDSHLSIVDSKELYWLYWLYWF